MKNKEQLSELIRESKELINTYKSTRLRDYELVDFAYEIVELQEKLINLIEQEQSN